MSKIKLIISRILEAIKDPSMTKTIFENQILTIIDKFRTHNNLVKSITHCFNTVDGIETLNVFIYLVESKTVEIIFKPTSHILEVEYCIKYKDNGQASLEDIFNTAKNLQSNLFKDANRYFGTIIL